MNNEIWKDIQSITPFKSLPTWKTLLLDAKSILPDVGPSIVLVFTALEVFISKALNEMAPYGNVDNELWKWINDRGFFLKEPSLKEQFSFLSKYLLGKSIKEKSELWEAFQNLQTARNSFAHNGIAKVGDKLVDVTKAEFFIQKADEIINYLKSNLHKDLQWLNSTHKCNFWIKQ